jgi:hypothetical protein
MVTRTWLETILKIVVMATTMCSGIMVPKYDWPVREGRYDGGREQDHQGLDRAA